MKRMTLFCEEDKKSLLFVYYELANKYTAPYWPRFVNQELLKEFCEAYSQYPKKSDIPSAENIPNTRGKDAQRLRDAYNALDISVFKDWV
jgi:hypothetical protein